MNRTERIEIRVSPEFKRTAQAAASEKGVTLSRYLTDLVESDTARRSSARVVVEHDLVEGATFPRQT